MNLSDLAAKGARPYGFMLSLALPKGWTEAWLAGLRRAASRPMRRTYGVPLVGGDTVATPGPLSPLHHGVRHRAGGPDPRRRGGARRGDVVFVSGTIGDGALGLAVGLGARGERCGSRRGAARPPRVALSRAASRASRCADLVLPHASAAMDVSDGLAGDLAKLCRASGVTATVDLDAVPLSEPARRACGMSRRRSSTSR